MHTMIKALEDVPCLIRFTKAAAHDHTFLKELDLEKGSFVVFDKAYNDYRQYLQWTEDDIYFVTRQKDNAVYTGIEEFDLSDNASDTVLKDERIGVEKDGKVIELRRVAYWDADKGKVFGFISNNFLIAPDKIAAIYKHRWQIETMFKRLKLPPEILPRGQSKCNRDTDMVRSDRSIANAGGTTQNKAKIGLFKHGINGKVPSDDIHRPVQVP